MPETIRAFIAIELPTQVREGIGQVQVAMQSMGLRGAWIRPENIHLTLRFLGDIRSAAIETIAGAMAEAAKSCGPFQLSGKSVGVFPNTDRPRVLWVGVAGQVERLQKLQHSLTEQLAGCGYPEERRRFHGHLTVARFKRPPPAGVLLQAIQAQAAFETEPSFAGELILLQSLLKPSGAVYSPLRRVGL